MNAVVLDKMRRTLSDGTRAAALTPQHCSIVETLAAAGCRTIGADTLIRRLWPDPDDEPEDPEKLIKVQICRLRGRIAAAGMKPIVGTAWGKGYALKEPVAVAGEDRLTVIGERTARDLRRLLETHPDRGLAHRIMDALGW